MREADAGSKPGRGEWRPQLRRKLAALFVIKVLALVALWALFFSPQHRKPVDASAMRQQLSLDSTQPRSGASP